MPDTDFRSLKLYMNDSGRVISPLAFSEICFGWYSRLHIAALASEMITIGVLNTHWSLTIRPLFTTVNCTFSFLTTSDRILISVSLLFHSGHGSEQENLRAEKEYEAAAAKGFRPCMSHCCPSPLFQRTLTFSIGPTCKKMNDLSAGKTFKSSAFEPSDGELTKAARSKRKQRTRSKREKFHLRRGC